jgi:hypothetical protein
LGAVIARRDVQPEIVDERRVDLGVVRVAAHVHVALPMVAQTSSTITVLVCT